MANRRKHISPVLCVLGRVHQPELDPDRDDGYWDDNDGSCSGCGSKESAPVILRRISSKKARYYLGHKGLDPSAINWLIKRSTP